MSRSNVSNRLFWALFLVTLLGTSLFIRWHVVALDHEVRREGLSNATFVACRSVLIDHVDIETGLRGFLVTGKKEFLRPYFEGLGRLEGHMATLRAAVAELPDERIAFELADGASRSVLVEFAAQINLVESDGLEAARARFVADPTKPGMDQVRAVLATIQGAEDLRMVASMETLGRSLATTIFLINAFAAVSAVLLVAMSFGFIRSPDGASKADL